MILRGMTCLNSRRKGVDMDRALATSAYAAVLVLLYVAAVSQALAADADAAPVRPAMIGHRGDGTGVFPDDCRPVTEWSERRNVVWKSPLANLGHTSPVCVGHRVFVMCEPGWEHDSPLLVCIDARDGKVLWQREVDQFSQLPDDQRQEAAALRTRFFELWREAYRMAYEAVDASEETIARLRARADELEIPYKQKGRVWSFGHNAFWHGKTPPYKTLEKEYDFKMPVWHYAVAGMAHATPVCDGEHIYVMTAYKVVACYDMQGELKWMRWHRDEPYTHYVQPDKWHERDRGMHFTSSFICSPVLIGDLLIVNANANLRAYDKHTGETRWERSLRQINYMLGPPVPLTLAAPDGESVDAVFLSSGELVRVSDGKVLTDNVGSFAAAVAPIALGGDTIFGVNGMSGGAYHIQPGRRFTEKGGVAVRFRLTGPDTAEAQQVWFNRKAGEYEMIPVFHRDLLFMNRIPLAFDAATGELRATPDRGRTGQYRTSESLCIAGGHIFALNNTGKCAVYKADESLAIVALNDLDETAPIEGRKREQIIAQTGKDGPESWYAWQFGRTSPFFSGNRIFIRSFDYLYCIGDADEPFRPSAAFDR